jgi:hypothetical protein
MDEYESFVEPVKLSARRKAPVRPGDMDLPSEVYTTMWFDQGGTTGWAIVSVWAEAVTLREFSILRNIISWSAGEFTGSEGSQVDQMMELVKAWEDNVDSIGYEDFILRTFSMGRELLSPVRLGARFEDRMYTSDRMNLLAPCQLASLAMSTVTDERLKMWGFWPPLTGKEHARDALKHCLTYLKRVRAAAIKTLPR